MIKKFLVLILVLLPLFALATEKIDINTATPEQLDELTGIGPKYAQAIIDARPFSSVDDLLRVKGIGEKTLAKIKEQGLACVNCAAAQNFEIQNPKSETNSNSQNSNVQNPTPEIIYPGGVFINEILPNPEGPDETDEWIKLYNSNNFDVDLAGWQVKDIAGTPGSFTMPADTTINKNSYLVFKRPQTKIMLNNDEDGLILLTPDGKTKDSMNFSKAPLGAIYKKTVSGWEWTGTGTLSAGSGPNGLPKIEKSDNNIVEAKDLMANISQDTNQKNPWFLFFTALAVTIISAAIVLFVRQKFKNLKI